MSNASVQPDPLERACSLIGRFLYHYSRVEQKIDQAVIKLLGLDEKVAPIVTGGIDFARKVNLVITAANRQASNSNDKEFAETTCGNVYRINDARQIVAHSSFEPSSDGGVQFSRTVAKNGKVSVATPRWTDMDFSQSYKKMSALETELDKLIELIKPVPLMPLGWLTGFHPYPYHRSRSAIQTMGTPLTLTAEPK